MQSSTAPRGLPHRASKIGNNPTRSRKKYVNIDRPEVLFAPAESITNRAQETSRLLFTCAHARHEFISCCPAHTSYNEATRADGILLVVVVKFWLAWNDACRIVLKLILMRYHFDIWALVFVSDLSSKLNYLLLMICFVFGKKYIFYAYDSFRCYQLLNEPSVIKGHVAKSSQKQYLAS